MKTSFTKRPYFVLLFFTAAAIALFKLSIFDHSHQPTLAELEKIGMPHESAEFSEEHGDDATSRYEYELRRLRDPQTGHIPDNIRARELNFARNLPTREYLQKNDGTQLFAADWVRRGPINVGGRTRALAVDINYNGTSNRRLLAGGVSGGIFLSSDDGATWQLTTTLAQLPSATCLAQDPNNRNVWYYGTGELLGSTLAGSRSIPGQGIFKSTDGGNTWSQLPATAQGSKTRFDNPFDFVWNLAIRPQSGAIFAATLGFIMRSIDGGNTWSSLLAGQDANGALSVFADVVVAANGEVYAALSRNGAALNNQQYGVFRSNNNGDQFTVISPPGLAPDPYRMVLAVAPSDSNTLYLLVQAKPAGAVASDHQFFRYNAASNTWTDLSASLPNATGLAGNASFCSQGGYDLIVKVKPDNANVVWIGGTNLYRSTNGGQSFTRVGGYLSAGAYAQFQNHHSDQHALAFFPNNPNAMISGSDGGLSKTTNVLAQPETWTSLNNGYIATQFYTVAVDPQAGSDFITGGTQDNGSWGTDVANFSTPWAALLTGDGAYTDIAAGGNPFYVSAQQGVIVRARRSNNQLLYTLVQPATPNGGNDFLFVAPFQLNPTDPRVMYLAVANGVWRNSNLDAITVVDNQNPVTTNWSALNNSAIPNTQVTTLAVSKIPANRLYFGATDYQANTVLLRVDNAPNNPAGTNITPAGVPGGAYPACIAINPNSADEIIAVFSNYRISGLWYSTNGGGSWTDIEGNLAGDEGPSMRWASIVPTNNGKVYFLATSTGVYSTTSLNGANTSWVQEGSTSIGNAVVDMIAARPADGLVVAGTHGRGVYSARVNTTAVDGSDENAGLPQEFLLSQNYPNPFSGGGTVASSNPETTIRYNLPSAGKISLAIYDMGGGLIKTLESGNKAAGEHVVRWDGSDSRGEGVASGVYFYRLNAVSANGAATSLTKRLTVVK
jgi:FlgD Ig-like domain